MTLTSNSFDVSRFNESNVFIASKLGSDFPISKFDLVLEYESALQDDSLRKLCEQSGLHYIGMRMKPAETKSLLNQEQSGTLENI